MKPVFESNGVSMYKGDSRQLLPNLPDESVHCCVTSPPYWGLRDYGTAQWAGGSAECDHVSGRANRTITDASAKQSTNGGSWASETRSVCPKCGATRQDQQIGLEATPYEYISTMRMLFAEVRRVLRSDGTLWLNMGDSYCGASSEHKDIGSFGKNSCISKKTQTGVPMNGRGERTRGMSKNGLKPKDLVGIPWMLAFALREDGWYLRQDIIWAKPNPMPESVTDRCTKSHEYIFLLSKSERYYYNQEAVREPWSCDRDDMREKGVRTGTAYLQQGGNGYSNSAKPHLPGNKTHKGLTAYENGQSEHRTKAGLVNYSEKLRADESLVANGRNKRSVWEVTTQPFPEAHFATFPEDLIKPCILAGCPEGGTVLDPFGGAGTTGLVARKLHCRAILLELNSEYIDISAKRLSQEVFQFGEAKAL